MLLDQLATLSHPQRLSVFKTYGRMRNRILVFAALPMDALSRACLQSRVDGIGRTPENA